MTEPRCEIPLGHPPQALQMGTGIHGPGTSAYNLSDRWGLHFYTYQAQLHINGFQLEIVPGSIGITPAGVTATYNFPKKNCIHLYAHFRLPTVLEKKADRTLVSMLLLQDVGERFESLSHAMSEAIGWFPSAPERANARLWDILWQLSDNVAGKKLQHRAVERARHYIERNLANNISIPHIAKVVGCSHNHLLRLFRDHMQCSIAAYIRRRRAERAEYLLKNSNVPIKTIPAQVGIANVQSLNKIIRRELGRAPRTIRRGA